MSGKRVVLAGFYPPPFAGEPVHVMQLTRLLRERGLTVRILNLNRQASAGHEYDSSGSRLGLLWKLLTTADAASILHLHTNGHSRKSWLMIFVAGLAGRLRGVTAILTLHSGLLPGHVAGFGPVRRRLARWILKPFARVICVNPEICRSVKGLGIAESQTAVIPAYLGVSGAPELSSSDRALIAGFRPLLVAVAGGEEDPERGLAVVLQAMQQLVSLHPALGAVLMGWQVGPKARPLIADLGLADHAVCLGEVSHDRCLALLRASDVTVRSTFVDGDAITVREALAFGVPVVASDTEFRPEGVTLFRRGDVSDLAAKLRQVLARPTGSDSVRRPADDPSAAIGRLYAELAGSEDPRADSSSLYPAPLRRPEGVVKLQRVLRMGFAEISCRARQEMSKWVDRRTDPRRSTLESSIRAEWIERWLDEMPLRFFAGPSDLRVPALMHERLPDSVHRIVASADRVLEKRFDLLGYCDLSFGDPIDWHLDPVAKRRAPLRHWTLLDPLDVATVGDCKVVWELNRHQWLVRLGQAYRLTGDGRYAAMFADTIRHWLRANPPGMGINWTSSLEIALRLISWCWALSLFQGAMALTPELRAALVEGVAAHASRVERYLSYYFSPNTHLTGEALGLFYAGTLFPAMPGAGRWQRLAVDILVGEAERQIFQDGVYMEQATCYQQYTAEIYLHFVILAVKNGIPVPDMVIRRLESLLDTLLVLRRPDTVLPEIGDADGGWLLPLEPRRPGDASGVFSAAAAVLRRGDYVWASGRLMPEVLWLLGTAGADVLACLEPRFPAQTPSRLLPDGGYVVMRTSWGSEADQVIFDVGPLGCPVSGGHGHADLLSIQASFRGEAYLVDPGTFTYTPEEGWRNYYRSTAAHNTVEIDQLGQAVPSAVFGWVSRPRAHLTRWISTSGIDCAAAEHRAYGRLRDPVLHRRTVHFLKPQYCVVVDDLEGAAEHGVCLRFQFAPMSVTLDPSGWVRASRDMAKGLLLHTFATSVLKTTIVQGETDPKQGWVSTSYGRHQPAPMLVCSLTATLPIRLITLLLPCDDVSATPPSVSPLIEKGCLCGLDLGHGCQRIRVDDLFPEERPTRNFS